MHPKWLERIIYHSVEYNGAAVHFKQWGAFIPADEVLDGWETGPGYPIGLNGKPNFDLTHPDTVVMTKRKKSQPHGALIQGYSLQEFPYQIEEFFHGSNSERPAAV